MRPAESVVLGGLGLRVHSNFLSAEQCADIIEQARRAQGRPATIYDGQDDEVVQTKRRRTMSLSLEAETRASLRCRFEDHMSRFASEFDKSLSGLKSMSLLRYDEGDFFTRHQDATSGRVSGSRQLSAVLSLSPNNDAPSGGYDGGEFVFYPPAVSAEADDGVGVGIPVRFEQGDLALFDATCFHEVRPVLAGCRFTIVTWYS